MGDTTQYLTLVISQDTNKPKRLRIDYTTPPLEGNGAVYYRDSHVDAIRSTMYKANYTELQNTDAGTAALVIKCNDKIRDVEKVQRNDKWGYILRVESPNQAKAKNLMTWFINTAEMIASGTDKNQVFVPERFDTAEWHYYMAPKFGALVSDAKRRTKKSSSSCTVC